MDAECQGFWAVAQTEPQREHVALKNLEREKFENYLPRIKSTVVVRGKKVDRIAPLFPGYIFVFIVDRWYAVMNTIGITRMLLWGDRPAQLSGQVIAEIRKREVHGFVKLPAPPRLRRGQSVRVIRGNFEGKLGIYEGMGPHVRERVLLDLLGRMVRVEIDPKDVVPLPLAFQPG